MFCPPTIVSVTVLNAPDKNIKMFYLWEVVSLSESMDFQ